MSSSGNPERFTPLDGCFLCRPEEDLVYAHGADGFALSGFGPLMPGYTVLAARLHIGSAADTVRPTPAFVGFAEQIRSTLARRYGSCLLTEHGRMPVCHAVDEHADAHCYHAHFLLFPGAPNVAEAATRYFRSVKTHLSLQSAVEAASMDEGEYFLLSPSPTTAFVMRGAIGIPRQFARVLVADSIGCSANADWSQRPARGLAVQYARDLRANLQS